jgi:hypothetical protein
MGRISDESLAKIKGIDLLTFLEIAGLGEIVRVGNGTYSTRAHDSLRISNGMWIQNSSGAAGKSALDYLIKVEGYTFVEAASKVWETCISTSPTLPNGPARHPAKAAQAKQFAVPLFTPQFVSDVVLYLIQKRKLDETVARKLIIKGDIVPSAVGGYCNAVFVGRDPGGAERYAFARGVYSDFKGEVAGSDKRFPFSYGNPNSEALYIYESAIDLLSDVTLMKASGEAAYEGGAFLSIGGVAPSRRKLPVAVEQYLGDHPQVNKVCLCFDNDGPGRSAARAIGEVLSGRADRFGMPLEVAERFPAESYKDFNDELCGKKITKAPAANEYSGLPALVQDGAIDIRKEIG